MRLLFIRHGDPDYENDCLTDKGVREALLLADRMRKETVSAAYVSPLGRARETAGPSLKVLGKEEVIMDWLREFPAEMDVNGQVTLQHAYPDTIREADGRFAKRICWDQLPAYLMADPDYWDRELWRLTPAAKSSDICEVYDHACRGLDEVLAAHGCRRSGRMYMTDQGNSDTVAFFCHFGITCVLLSHLWDVSPFILWHCLAMAPTSVTEVYTEERERGMVWFRASAVGDISHLNAGGEKPSFSARFCERFDNFDERH